MLKTKDDILLELGNKMTKKRRKFLQECILILEQYNEEFITWEIKRLSRQQAIYKNRLKYLDKIRDSNIIVNIQEMIRDIRAKLKGLKFLYVKKQKKSTSR